MQKYTFAVIGCGRVGQALALALKKAGYPVSLLIDRDKDTLKTVKSHFHDAIVRSDFHHFPDFDGLFIAVNDDAIPSVINQLLKHQIDLTEKIVAHTSGALSSDILAPLKQSGARLASAHPVQTFTGDPNDEDKFQSTYVALEGDPIAVRTLESVLSSLGGKHFVIPSENKTTHHLACVMVSNYVVTLMNMAVDLLSSDHISREKAKVILSPLMKNAIENISQKKLPDALTGPIKRGDINTVQQHVQFLKKHHKNLCTLYAGLGLETVTLARMKDQSPDGNLTKIEKLLHEAMESGQ